MSVEYERLAAWWKHQNEQPPTPGLTWEESFLVKRGSIPSDALRTAVRKRVGGVQHQRVWDPTSGGSHDLYWTATGGVIHVVGADVEEPAAYLLAGAEGAHCRQAHRRATRNTYVSVGISCVLPIDPGLKDVFALLAPLAVRRPVRRAPAWEVGILIATPQGLRVQSFPMPRRKLIPENYMPEVAPQVGDLRKFLQGKTPYDAGRLALIDGPPGTGKTHIIHALLAAKTECTLIPGSVGAVLNQPGFVPWLLEHCEDRGGNIALILEDADELLRHRDQGGSLSVLSGLLNTTSGLMAHLTGLRILATVNTADAAGSTLDPAVLRPGRLYTRIHVGPLTRERARAVVLRESGSDLAAARVDGPRTLADCYEIAREARGA